MIIKIIKIITTIVKITLIMRHIGGAHDGKRLGRRVVDFPQILL